MSLNQCKCPLHYLAKKILYSCWVHLPSLWSTVAAEITIRRGGRFKLLQN